MKHSIPWPTVELSPHFPFFHIYYCGVCSDVIKSIIPPKASFFARNTRFSMIQHTYPLNLDPTRTNAFAISSIDRTSRDWNWFLPSVFFATYISFSLSRPASTYTSNSDPFPEISSSLHDTRVHRGPQRLYLFGPTLLASISLYIKNKQTLIQQPVTIRYFSGQFFCPVKI